MTMQRLSHEDNKIFEDILKTELEENTKKSLQKGTTKRYNKGKPDMSLIPLCTLIEEVKVWEFGATKYEKFNWMKGTSWMAVLSSTLRHLASWQSGQDVDEESGCLHIACAMANLRMLLLYAKTYKEGDDRPPKELL
jgi:hypothetical protein